MSKAISVDVTWLEHIRTVVPLRLSANLYNLAIDSDASNAS